MQSTGIDSLQDREEVVTKLKLRIAKFKKDHAELWNKKYDYPEVRVIEETQLESESTTPSIYKLMLKNQLAEN